MFSVLRPPEERATLVSQCGRQSTFINLSHSSLSALKGKEKLNEFRKVGLVVQKECNLGMYKNHLYCESKSHLKKGVLEYRGLNCCHSDSLRKTKGFKSIRIQDRLAHLPAEDSGLTISDS